MMNIDLSLTPYIMMVALSAILAFANATLLLWQAPTRRVNLLMGLYMLVIGTILLNNGLLRLTSFITPIPTEFLSTLVHVQLYLLPPSMWLLFAALVYYSDLFSERASAWLVYGNGAFLVVYWLVLWLEPTWVLRNLDALEFLADGTLFLDAGLPLIAIQVIVLIWLIGVAVISWRGHGHRVVFWAGLMTLAVVFIDAIPGIRDWNFTSVLGIVARLLYTYAVLDDSLFSPLRHSNQELRAKTNALARANELVERKVLERTAELEAALSETTSLSSQLEISLSREEELSDLKSEIITVVSHEFRTPLTVINGAADLLNLYYDRLSPQKREEQHHRIQQSIRYLTDLLEDVTTVDEISNHHIVPELVSLSFDQICQLLKQRCQAHFEGVSRIRYQFDHCDCTVNVDMELSDRLLCALVSNALKYSEGASPVVVELRCRGRFWEIDVSDEGIGVPVDEQDKIFDLFYRASNVETRSGLGIGLHIVSEITMALQGSVIVLSAGAEQGSRFRVQLPT